MLILRKFKNVKKVEAQTKKSFSYKKNVYDSPNRLLIFHLRMLRKVMLLMCINFSIHKSSFFYFSSGRGSIAAVFVFWFSIDF